MSRSLFDDLHTARSAQFESADSRTLRLAAHPFTAEELEALVRYQEAFLAHAEQPSVGHETLSAAHQLGLQASGMEDTKVVELGLSLLRAFCGQRWTARRLGARLDELEADPSASEKVRKARDELRRLEDLDPLARRYGQEAIDLLRQHEDRLLALHTRMQKALTGG
jgi:hypothetical protein